MLVLFRFYSLFSFSPQIVPLWWFFSFIRALSPPLGRSSLCLWSEGGICSPAPISVLIPGIAQKHLLTGLRGKKLRKYVFPLEKSVSIFVKTRQTEVCLSVNGLR